MRVLRCAGRDGHAGPVIRPVAPEVDAPFTTRWAPPRVRAPAVLRLIEHVFAMTPPVGWRAFGRG